MIKKNKEKIAVILFNLGAPDNLQAVRPFLFNLFFDKNIIRLPYFLRLPLAYLISKKRDKTAQEIYKILGGGSPLLPNTQKQADLLQKNLNKDKKKQFQCFIAMRYWHPMIKQTLEQVKDFNPDKIILLPLYPQYSTTTSGSSLQQWHKFAPEYKNITQEVCCYPDNQGFIDASAMLLNQQLKKIKNFSEWRILFSAHGLPQNIVDAGDPYCQQIELTAQKIADKINDKPEWLVCYQSRVGPLKWVEPYTEDEIIRAGSDKKSLIVMPIAFVSEHSETLVELDHEYRELAEENHVKTYIRINTVSENPNFIDGLTDEVDNILKSDKKLVSSCSGFQCAKKYKDCPHH